MKQSTVNIVIITINNMTLIVITVQDGYGL